MRLNINGVRKAAPCFCDCINGIYYFLRNRYDVSIVVEVLTDTDNFLIKLKMSQLVFLKAQNFSRMYIL